MLNNLLIHVFLSALLFGASVGSALADKRKTPDHEIARRALLDGRIKPLAEIKAQVTPHLPGKVIGVEFEVDDFGRLVYEFDVVTPEGRLKEVDVDAATAEILSIEDEN